MRRDGCFLERDAAGLAESDASSPRLRLGGAVATFADPGGGRDGLSKIAFSASTSSDERPRGVHPCLLMAASMSFLLTSLALCTSEYQVGSGSFHSCFRSGSGDLSPKKGGVVRY